MESLLMLKHGLDEYQPIPVKRKITGNEIKVAPEREIPFHRKKKTSKPKFWISLLVVISVYFLAPLRSNILILGTDYLPHRDSLSRTDTSILLTINPLKPYLGMLSVPRDLWVVIPGYGENRINTAYFFAEAADPGSGPYAAIDTFRQNFGITLKFYIVIKMEGLVKVIDSMGGVEVDLPAAMGGLPMGKNQLDGTQALAFARERYSADDFSRMKQGQILIGAAIKKITSLRVFFKIPIIFIESLRAVETNIPWWLIPRLGLALFRSSSVGMDTQVITREMVTPFTTYDGAQVLAPNWDAINPVLLKMFGE